MKLQPLTKFTLEQKLRTDIDLAQRFINCFEYATFLQQPLTIGMFTACNEDGVPYKSYLTFSHSTDIGNFICEPYEGLFEIQANEKSKGWAYLDPERTRYYDKVSYTKAKADFEKAKERVLFKGFEIKEFNGSSLSVTKVFSFNDVFCVFWFDGDLKKWYLSIGLFTVEDLVKCGLELSEYAIKQLNL